MTIFLQYPALAFLRCFGSAVADGCYEVWRQEEANKKQRSSFLDKTALNGNIFPLEFGFGLTLRGRTQCRYSVGRAKPAFRECDLSHSRFPSSASNFVPKAINPAAQRRAVSASTCYPKSRPQHAMPAFSLFFITVAKKFTLLCGLEAPRSIIR
jgi:hypothetical protein